MWGKYMAKMNEVEFQEFLEQPNIAHLTVLDESNKPYPVPVWFSYEDKNLWLISNIISKKIEYIRKIPDVSLSIANSIRPYQYVIFNGIAEIIDPADPNKIIQVCTKYDGEVEGKKFAKMAMESRHTIIIKIKISKTNAWIDR
jgi:nitroimidazol reductase NimA-like FMN-containing flavoprotein (pyridoxamine 5'-phosphate oxidase superfamily)